MAPGWVPMPVAWRPPRCSRQVRRCWPLSAFGTWCARCRRGAWCAGRGGRCLGLAAQRGDVECGLVGHRAARRRPVGKLVGMRTSRRGNEASPEISIARIEALRQLVEGRGGIPAGADSAIAGCSDGAVLAGRGSGWACGLAMAEGRSSGVFAPQHSFAAQLEAEHHDRIIVNRLAGADDDPAVLSRAGERNARLPDPGRSAPLPGERRMQELSALAPAIRVISILSGSPIAD